MQANVLVTERMEGSVVLRQKPLELFESSSAHSGGDDESDRQNTEKGSTG
jgi:hypothetical protein